MSSSLCRASSTEPLYRIGSILRGPSGAREETQFGLFGHGRIENFGDSDPSAPAAVLTMATRDKPNTKRGRLTACLPKNLLQIPKSYAVYSWPGRFSRPYPASPTVPFNGYDSMRLEDSDRRFGRGRETATTLRCIPQPCQSQDDEVTRVRACEPPWLCRTANKSRGGVWRGASDDSPLLDPLGMIILNDNKLLGIRAAKRPGEN